MAPLPRVRTVSFVAPLPRSWRRSRSSCSAVTVLLLLAACSADDRSPPRDAVPHSVATAAGDGLRVAGASGGVLLTNSDTVPLYFAVYDAAILPRIEWAPCTEPAACPAVQPGAERTVALADLGSDTAIVFWWRLSADAAGRFVPDSIRAVPVVVR